MHTEPVQTCFSVYNQIFFEDHIQKTEKNAKESHECSTYRQKSDGRNVNKIKQENRRSGYSRLDYWDHGLINYVDTKVKCRHKENWPVKVICGKCFTEFIGWRYSQSCWYYQHSFVTCCPSNLLSGSTLPPYPFHVWISILFTCTQYVGGGGEGFGVLGLRQINTCRKIPLHCTGHFFKMTTFCIVFYESYLFTTETQANRFQDG